MVTLDLKKIFEKKYSRSDRSRRRHTTECANVKSNQRIASTICTLVRTLRYTRRVQSIHTRHGGHSGAMAIAAATHIIKFDIVLLEFARKYRCIWGAHAKEQNSLQSLLVLALRCVCACFPSVVNTFKRSRCIRFNARCARERELLRLHEINIYFSSCKTMMLYGMLSGSMPHG